MAMKTTPVVPGCFAPKRADSSPAAGRCTAGDSFPTPAPAANAIIDLAHNLGHRVVAEGVEEKRVVELLKGLGCDLGQGYFFAKPAPLADVTEWLEEAWPDRLTAHGHRRRPILRDRV